GHPFSRGLQSSPYPRMRHNSICATPDHVRSQAPLCRHCHAPNFRHCRAGGNPVLAHKNPIFPGYSYTFDNAPCKWRDHAL
ncbi:MAG: hypothetical protein Q8K36_01555, partial [Alphaproteobacteria bacterium]|nr:hypothetical protein [Alphaproteobacteria bacterium]